MSGLLCGYGEKYQAFSLIIAINSVITHVDCEDGDVQLVGGSSEAEGTIQICFNNQWGLISESGWSQKDAQVVCRELGFLVEGLKHDH